MSGIASAPIREMVIDQEGYAMPQWTLFFNRIAGGDAGTAWVPTFNNLTQAGGAASFDALYIYLTKRLVYFRIKITPASGGTTSSTSGSTEITNFPLSIAQNSLVLVSYGATGAGIGVVSAVDNKVYPPAWTTVGTPVTLVGVCEVV